MWAESSYTEWVLDVAIALARALSVSHDKGIVHCDIKPSNILVSEDGRPILFDFNIAFRELALNSPANVGGTVPYMAPEQLMAFCGRGIDGVGPRSDLFALGATIYELLTGILPYGSMSGNVPGSIRRSPDTADQLLSLRRLPPPGIRQQNSNVPPEFADLIQSCLAFRADDRPRSAAELADQLERFKKRINSRFSMRRRFAGALAGTAVALAVAATVFMGRNPEARFLLARIPDGSAVTRDEGNALDPPLQLTAQEIESRMKRGYLLLQNAQPDQAATVFQEVLAADIHHAGRSSD